MFSERGLRAGSPAASLFRVLSLSAFTLLCDHTGLRGGQLAAVSQVAANFLALNFKGTLGLQFLLLLLLASAVSDTRLHLYLRRGF